MPITSVELLALKREILEKRFSRMNDMQRQAIFRAQGPVLILAGAGSGKTTVLVNRVAYLLDFGNSYFDDSVPGELSDEDISFLQAVASGNGSDEDRLKRLISSARINPWNVLAITFTNKAAAELKERLSAQLGEAAAHINAGTFHSVCVRMLRREISALGYSQSFTIYDTDDSIRVLKDCLSELNMDDKMFPPKPLLSEIGRAKDSLLTPEEYQAQNSADFRKNAVGNIYALYQRKLKSANALDFDDIICLTVKLFLEYPDVLEHYQNLYKYILVDEYQDTNHAQYKLVSLLSAKSKNLCVVGDDDQSIYKFRGATIENILSFESEYKNAKVIRLEQNYRSTQNILDAANEVIKNNLSRKGKNLWTDNGEGEKVTYYRATSEGGEAMFVARAIEDNVQKGMRFGDHAVLYRMNAQSASIEQQLVRAGIPYKIVGGHKFFDRKEIKDVLAYFHVIVNPQDSVRLKRIINEPKRGIGDATIAAVEQLASELSIPMLDLMRDSQQYAVISKKSGSLMEFAQMIDELSDLSLRVPLNELLDELMEKSSYRMSLIAQGREGVGRLENIEELKTTLIKFEEENEEASLSDFLEEVSLYTDLDSVNSSDDSVILMTMHSAKGLEFKTVFVVGMEESIFPSYLSSTNETEMEEERRLAYVALTRAKELLFLTNSSQRMLFGRTGRNMPSRFIREIPEQYLNVIDDTLKAHTQRERLVKPKPTYKPELEGTVGVRKPMEKVDVSYAIGDTVSHKMFGKGVVLSMTKMSNDTLVEVRFEGVGIKKIMANFAKLVKI